MVIKTENFEIYGYDPTDSDQRHLKYTLKNDENFLKYVTKKLDERLAESKMPPGGGLQFNCSYLVKFHDDFVGYIRLEELDRVGNLNLQCAVSPDFRNQKLGGKILEEISNYILENYQEVKKLKGVIDRSNYASKAMANRVGFQEESRDDNYITVSKERR